MSSRDNIWVSKLHVEVHMLDPFNFDPENEIIVSYIEQQLRSKEIVPPVGTLIPITIGSSCGIVKVVKKTPARAFKFPSTALGVEYLNVAVKRATGRNNSTSRWKYRPNSMEPLWEDEAQHRNAQMLKTYLTNPKARRISPLVLLDGQPGTGKSMTIDYVLSRLGRPFTILKQVSVASSYIGETANNIIDITREAIENKPSIVIFEEADGTFLSRWISDPMAGSTRHHAEELVSTMLQCLDMMAGEEDIFVLATTNMNPDDMHIIDPAILSRVGMRLSFGNPSDETVRKVMRTLSERDKVPLENVQNAMSEIVGTRKPNYRDITAAISRAQLMELAGLDMVPCKKVKPRDQVYIH
ncbi:MAG: ATP-binding protein [Candidatus Thermoplasmatota archaeon]|nr:ATP-binding protein [Candidatus Thermoplasmatota archaeon]MBU4070691.1 ATP-binding protein [Candidatus Thermoplasmatota archaeon]MBU4145265.1 ATP-binding protein [Candidatus Thermoplasmatota archaeon]MBU4591253.1 ATP-binding protein [Candidatus Thermoplasmatota archaeon]